MGFAFAGVVTPPVAPSSQSVEAATVDSGIAAQFARSEDGNNKCVQRADVTKPQTQANGPTAVASERTGDELAKPA